ncbi:Hemicentin-2 [Stylophora pistillata]|uniref:Hemicentin-2 n=1 Tax=Stylophora pistillata TaxID=50429 RepID=A0A2B4SP56_STYPI|nr:Hemicentin-2 [Stylophora pistillata]
MKTPNLDAVVRYRRPELLYFLVLAFSLLNNACTQNYHTGSLDEIRNALISYSFGSSKPGGASGSKPREPSNSFLRIVDQIEKSVYDVQAMKIYYDHSPARLRKITDYIKLANKQGNSQLMLQLLGHGLYTTMEIEKRNETTTHRRGLKRQRRCSACPFALKNYMDIISREVGTEKFGKMMAVNEEVTLAFAIDDTGSMATEIEAAKAIAKYIINTPRENMDIDYVLSPFNDPKTGPITQMPAGKGKEFITAIESLTPNGGKDCPELAFKGIIDALKSEIKEGSPLYVFTDATAKDPHQLDAARNLATEMKSSVYFFTTGLCGSSKYKTYEDLAKATCGQVFELPKSGSDFSKIKKISKNLLGGTACVSSSSAGGSPTGRRKKRSSFTVYKIPLDDSVDRVIISVTTQNGGQTINLQDPLGVPVSTEGRTDLAKGAIFMVDHPKPGM